MLIGSGCVKEIETAAVTLGEYGQAPRFQDAIENSKIKIKDSTCPALHAQLQATEKSVPFMPLRGIIGSDLYHNRKDWSVIDNPMKTNFKDDEKIVILPAVQLDVLIFHAAKADINGNVQIGRRRELATLAHASKKVYVTVEEIVNEDFFECELTKVFRTENGLEMTCSSTIFGTKNFDLSGAVDAMVFRPAGKTTPIGQKYTVLTWQVGRTNGNNLRLNEEGVLIDTIRLRTQNIPLNQIKSITKNGKTYKTLEFLL